MNTLAPFLGRIIAIIVGWAAAQLAVRFGFQVDSATQAQLVEHIVNIVVLLLGVYAMSHKWLNKWINPGDAASSNITKVEKAQAERLKS